jgi:hypothetical protein
MTPMVAAEPELGAPDYAAFRACALARLSARTGHFLQRSDDRQHFFLTLPALISLRTRSAGVLLTLRPN